MTDTQQTAHIPVLRELVYTHLKLRPGDTVIDGTIGGGGHARMFAEAIGPSGTLIGIDQDGKAIERARNFLQGTTCTLHLVHENFRNIDRICDSLGIRDVDAFFLDLGWSSDQIVDPEIGISFLREAPLSMLLKRERSIKDITASDIINTWKEEVIADLLFAYGDERKSRVIARAIVEQRHKAPITTTTELAECIQNRIGRHGRTHPATKTFQALRIAVNDEFGALREGIPKAIKLLKSKGRGGIISFHSGEDRIVKHTFRNLENESIIKIITKKPLIAPRNEQKDNPRSRSAKLRIIEKI